MNKHYQSIRNSAKRPLHLLKSPILSANYRRGNFQQAAWLIGDGRSGTTWASELIRNALHYRIVYEPFHPDCINEKPFMPINSYLRPNESNIPNSELATQVFSGKFSHERTDGRNFRPIYKGLLVKDIFANLFANWVANRFPDLKIIFLIRNPFAVALSKYKKRSWLWMTEPSNFLNQNALYEDYLQPYEELIHNIGDDYISKQLLIWAIIHYIPLHQFKQNQIHVVFFEDIFTDPKKEFINMAKHLMPESEPINLKVRDKVFKRPSKVSGKESNIILGNSPITSWRNELSNTQIDTGLRILEQFGLDKMYHENGFPNRRSSEFL